MDPNSGNQRWSLWEYRVYPTRDRRPAYAQVKANAARFGRKAFGAASEMRLRCATDWRGLYWEVAVLTEGHPVHDPAYVAWMHAQWARFLRHGFGDDSVIQSHARLEAGDRQDGRPADQLIVLPALRVEGVPCG